MARDTAPYAFLQLGSRWVNMALVTDIEDHGDSLVLSLAADVPRLAGRGDDAVPLDVGKRIRVEEDEAVHELREWLKLNDE